MHILSSTTTASQPLRVERIEGAWCVALSYFLELEDTFEALSPSTGIALREAFVQEAHDSASES